MFELNPTIESKILSADRKSLDMLTDILMSIALSSDVPEESKIEAEIMQAYRTLDDALHYAFRGFATPIPPAGKETQLRVYPARKAFLEYLQLTKAGLENFLVNVPVPDIPPEYIKRADNLFEL